MSSLRTILPSISPSTWTTTRAGYLDYTKNSLPSSYLTTNTTFSSYGVIICHQSSSNTSGGWTTPVSYSGAGRLDLAALNIWSNSGGSAYIIITIDGSTIVNTSFTGYSGVAGVIGDAIVSCDYSNPTTATFSHVCTARPIVFSTSLNIQILGGGGTSGQYAQCTLVYKYSTI